MGTFHNEIFKDAAIGLPGLARARKKLFLALRVRLASAKTHPAEAICQRKKTVAELMRKTALSSF